MPYIVYILENQDNRYYIGSTTNLERRLQEHNRGKGSFTKDNGPWKVIYTEQYLSISEARKRELAIKNKKRKSYIAWLISQDKMQW